MYLLQKHLGPVRFALLILTAVLIGIYVIKPVSVYAVNDLSTVVEQFKFISTHKSSLSLKDSLQSLEQASKKSQELIEAVPQDGRASYILEQLLKGAEKDSLVLSDINSLDEVNHGHYIEYPFDISIKGVYPNLQRYLIDLENKNMVIKIRKLNIETEGMNKKDLDINLELSAFVLTRK